MECEKGYILKSENKTQIEQMTQLLEFTKKTQMLLKDLLSMANPDLFYNL